MQKRKTSLITISILIVLSFASSVGVHAIDTQFKYDKLNPAWLDEIQVKEDLLTIGNIPKTSYLIANTDYPYTQTAESFKKVVNQDVKLYSVNMTSDDRRAAYLYAFDLLNEYSLAYKDGVSDEYIQSWLESKGIVYPPSDQITNETKILARSLYSLLKAQPDYLKLPVGTTVEGAFVIYLSKMSSKDLSQLEKLSPNASIENISQYFTAFGKLSLANQGYSVTAETSDAELMKLLAVMTIETAGLTVDAESDSLDNIRTKLLAVMLGRLYDVTLDPTLLADALSKDNVPFYVLQAMGQDNNLTVKNDTSYEAAFDIICKNTNCFALEDIFYADITDYDVNLEYKRDAVWIMPRFYQKNDDSKQQKVYVYIDGKEAVENDYNKITLDKSQPSTTVKIDARYVQTKNNTILTDQTVTYTVKINQGDTEPPEDETKEQQTTTDLQVPGIVKDIFSQFGIANLPENITSILNLLTPNFDTESQSQGFDFLGQIESTPDTLVTPLLTKAFSLFEVRFNNPSTTATASKADDGTLGGVGGIDINTGFNPIGGSSSQSSASASNHAILASMSAQYDSLTYKHVSEMDAAPTGYEYITDSNGYVLGMSKTAENNARQVNTILPISLSEDNSRFLSFLKNNALFISIALSVIALMIVTRVVLKKRTIKKPQNFSEMN